MNSPVHALVVEDNPADAFLQKMALRNILPVEFDVRCTSMLSEACGLLRDGRFDVILLDLGLPDSCGLETLSRVRAADPVTAIVVLTGASDYDLAPQALDVGAQDFLLKSDVNSDTLHRTIQQAVHRKKLDDARIADMKHREDALKDRIEFAVTAISSALNAIESGGEMDDWNRTAAEVLAALRKPVSGEYAK